RSSPPRRLSTAKSVQPGRRSPASPGERGPEADGPQPLPELSRLFEACQNRFLMAHPPPDISPGQAAREEDAPAAARGRAGAAVRLRSRQPGDAAEHPSRPAPGARAGCALGQKRRSGAGGSDAYASLIASRAETITCVRELARPALDFRTWPLMTSRGLSDGEAARVLTGAFAGAA